MKCSRFYTRWLAVIVFGLANLFGLGFALGQNRPLGIDVSSFQGSADTTPTNINWTNVAKANIAFAWAKATEGTDYIDADFVYNMTHAKAAHIPIGAYHFCHPEEHLGTAGADLEAGYFWNQVKPYVVGGGFYMVPMLDFEQDVTSASPAYTQSTLTAWVNEWCQDIVNFGKSNGVTIKPIVYTYTSYSAGTSGNGPGVNKTVQQWPLWMAASLNGQTAQTGNPSSVTPWTNWAVWQYGAVTVSGVEGAVDADVFDGTASTLANLIIGGPGVSNEPVNITAAVGTDPAFSVTASGGTLHYQWEFDGATISGATDSNYVVNNVQLTNAGYYNVMVSNSSGSVLSTPGVLSVEGPQTNFPTTTALAPTTMVNWWPAEGNCMDIFSGTSASPLGNLSFPAGEAGQAFHFDGSTTTITTGLGDLLVPWTACMWVNRQNTPQTSAALLEDGTYSLKLEQYNGTHEVGVSILGVADAVFPGPYTVPQNTWTHLAFVGTSSGTSLYVNGVFKSSLTNVIPLPRNYIGAGYIASSTKYVDFMLGSMDELMTFSSALSAAQINAIYLSGNGGLIRAPEFTGIPTFINTNQFKLLLKGLTGKPFFIQSSTDLMTWKTGGAISGTLGTNQFTDINATNSQTFYRVYQP